MYEMFEQVLAVAKKQGSIKAIDLHEKGTYCKEGFGIDGVLADGKRFSMRFEVIEPKDSEG